MNTIVKVIFFIIGVIGFACIRLFENVLFYDPLISFFKGNFQSSAFPELEFWKYSLNLAFRFLLNMGISIGLIWILFQKNTYLKFALVLFSLLFVVGVLMFWVVEHDISTESYMILFYIRRFIIQPLLIIVLIPAFYFQQLSSKVEK